MRTKVLETCILGIHYGLLCSEWGHQLIVVRQFGRATHAKKV